MNSEILCKSVPSRTRPYFSRNNVQLWCQDDFWSLDNLATLYKENLSFRTCKKDVYGLKETECEIIIASFNDLKDWLSSNASDENPLKFLDCQEYWLYADYLDLNENTSLAFVEERCKWSDLFPFINTIGKSTIWFGTQGSNTTLHYDSYGVNLVAQLHGRKKWTLFPPSSSENLYPIRIPLEESTIFSQVNIRNPDLVRHPKFSSAPCYEVVLNSGDILFVPKHWWHYVESLDNFTVSINIWLDQGTEDNQERISETLTQLTSFLVHENFPDLPSEILLHRKELDLFLKEDWNEILLGYINGLIKPQDSHENLDKIEKSHNKTEINWQLVNPKPIGDYNAKEINMKRSKLDEEIKRITSLDILKAFTHPKTIDTIKNILLNKS